MIKVAPYLRVSTDKEEQQDSLVYQQKMFENMAIEKGWEIYDFYVDSKTGTVANRKNLKRLIDDAIARSLYNEGYRTPDQVVGKKNQSELWHGSTIRMILSNYHYTGKLVQSREETISVVNKRRRVKSEDEYIVVEGTHEAIISQEDFDIVRSLLESRKKRKDDGTLGRVHTNTNLFTNMISCADCGSGFHFKRNRKGYICGRYDKHGKKACSEHLILEDELVEIITKDLNKLSQNISSTSKYATIKERVAKNKEKVNKEMRVINKKIDSINGFNTKAVNGKNL